jgi:membrane associated rhomboid family serine protease
LNKILNNIRDSVAYPAFIVAILWITHGYFYLSGSDKSVYAMLPRTQEGLWGVLFSPFLHANLEHLASNSLPLMVLMTGVIYFYRQISAQTLLLTFLFTQAFVWSFARQSFHIGASGIVYSLFGFILGMGIFQRNIKSIVLALLLISFYGGMIWGVLPGQEGVSWESHLLGFLSGILVAFLFRNEVEPDDEAVNGHTPFAFRHKPHDINKDGRAFLLPRNTFAGLRPKYTPDEPETDPEWQHFQTMFEQRFKNENPTQQPNMEDFNKNTGNNFANDLDKNKDSTQQNDFIKPKNDSGLWTTTQSW